MALLKRRAGPVSLAHCWLVDDDTKIMTLPLAALNTASAQRKPDLRYQIPVTVEAALHVRK